jgi:hypothetical protein
VRNNPLGYTDPSGHRECDEQFGCEGGGTIGGSGTGSGGGTGGTGTGSGGGTSGTGTGDADSGTGVCWQETCNPAYWDPYTGKSELLDYLGWDVSPGNPDFVMDPEIWKEARDDIYQNRDFDLIVTNAYEKGVKNPVTLDEIFEGYYEHDPLNDMTEQVMGSRAAYPMYVMFLELAELDPQHIPNYEPNFLAALMEKDRIAFSTAMERWANLPTNDKQVLLYVRLRLYREKQ